MIKQYWKPLALSSALLLLPAAVRFDEGWTAWVLSAFALSTHWLCVWLTLRDPRNRNQSPKILNTIFWLMPAITLLGGQGLFREWPEWSELSIVVLIALMFLFLGNSMPKVRPNFTYGIKVKWTLENEENWTMTHRFAGKLWVGGGLMMLAGLWFDSEVTMWIMMAVVSVLAVAPLLYSYGYSRKQRKAGTYVATPLPKSLYTVSIGVVMFLGILIVVLLGLLFTGDITVVCSEDALEIQADYWPDRTVTYQDIDSMVLRTNVEPGSRVSGYGSPRLLMGAFRNGEFGSYTRYSYTQATASIVLEVKGRILVLSLESDAQTQALYETLQTYIP